MLGTYIPPITEPVQVIHALIWPSGECVLPGQDAEGPVDGGEVGSEVRAGIPADCPVDQFADQFSAGDTRCSRGPVQRGGLAFGEA